MAETLRVLILEDRASDALLAVEELRAAGVEFEWKQVDTESAFRAQLETRPDLILADDALPQFDGLRALHIVREHNLDIPFIILSGSIGEDQAVAAMQQGADDYLQKDRLARLAPAVQRVLERKRTRHEQRRTEQALHESEQRFRALIEHSPDVMLLLNADGQVLYASPALTRALGYDVEVCVGRHLDDFVHPGDADIFQQALTLGLQTTAPSQPVLVRLLHLDASWRWMEGVILNLLDVPEVQALVASFRDVTERKQREREMEVIATVSEALRVAPTRAEMLSIIARQTHSLLAVDGIALAMRDPLTQETVVTLARGAWLGRTGLRLPPDLGVTGHVIATGQLYLNNAAESDPQLLWQDEAVLFQAVACVPLNAERHTIGALLVGRQRPGAIFSAHDLHLLSSIGEIGANALYRSQVLESLEKRIEERMRELSAANERLRELDRLKSQFVSDVSHELRTPVTNLKLYIELLEIGNPEKFAGYLTILKQQSRRLTDLVESILDLSRLERGQDSATFEPLDLNPLVEQVIVAHLPRAAAANLQLVFDPGSGLPLVHGAADQLMQVVTNLVANALNYTVAGRVSVSTRYIEDQVCLQVRDTGVGIAPGDMPHLFERFYRGRNVSRSIHPGTGLGLAIVKEIVDTHQGRIEVESQPGIGTTFSVYLPAVEADSP